MISRIVVHTVYVIIIMCYFIVSCIPVLIILYLTKIYNNNNNNNNNASKHTYTCITQLKLTILKGCLGTSE